MITHCSPTLLESALAGNLPPADESALHRHLESCPECSAALERLAGGTEWCREAAALLAGDELDAAVPAREEWSDVDFTVEHLEPSDKPNVLGRLGGYDVLEVIGRGGMSVVLKGYDRELKRCVAIKVLAPHLAQSSLAKKRFAREAQAAAAVVHPHVLAIHQVQAGGRLPFLVMPLVSGETLGARLAAEGTLELKEILRIGMQAAAGLAAAHEQGLVHRDVKPANILLEKGVERAVLTDFGLARAGDDVALTRWGIIAGTPEYMSPEQARGEPLDGRSDLFSLGCVLYQMATGVSPFRADSVIATMRRLVDEAPRSPASLNPELPPWFIAIVDRLLQKDPAKRFGSAREVSELLEGCLAHVQQPTTVPLPGALIPHTARGRLVFASHRKGVFAMLGVSCAVLLGLMLWQPSEAPDIAGTWIGDDWGVVTLELKEPGRYEGRYSTADAARSGTLQLKWSRFWSRFNGVWQEGDSGGRLSLRLVDDEIRGGWTTREGAKGERETPPLADLLWLRSQSLVAAVMQFNQSTAEVRRELFTPPIPDLTVERLREGFKQSALLYRRAGKTRVADALQRIAESGRLPDDASQLIGSGIHGQDENGATISRQVVPALTLPDDSVASGYSLVVLRPLELIYRKGGRVSKDYGDLFDGEAQSAPVGSDANAARLMVRSPEIGYLKGLHVKEGDYVKEGQTIATLGRMTIPSTREGGVNKPEPDEIILRAPCDAKVLKVYGQDWPPPATFGPGAAVVELQAVQGPAVLGTTTPIPATGWGEAVGGVRIRANTVKPQWPADEPVELSLDLNNESGGQFGMARIPYCEVEIDGAWYVAALTERLVAGSYVVWQGIHERVAVVRLTRNEWVLKSAVKGDIQADDRAYFRELLLATADPANQLQLAPGRHTIRVACEVDGRARLPISQPVEIEVVAGKETSAAGVDPPGAVAPEAGSRFLTAEQAVAQGQELYHSRQQVTVRFRVGTIQPRTVTDPDGSSSEWWQLHAESAPDFSASLSPQAQAALGGNGIAAAERHFTGRLVDVTGSVTGIGLDLVSRPDTIWTFQIDVASLDQIRLVDAASARGEPGAAASGQPDDSHTAGETPGIRVELLLNVETHSRELMNRNVGFDGISLMGTGVRGTIDGKESDNLVAVLAHHCRLETFAENESSGRKYWQAAFFVPQGPTSDGSNRSLSQERLDQMQEQGVLFTLDHTRDQPSSVPAFPQPQTETITPERLNYFTTGHGITVACSADGKLIAVANGNPTRILQVGGTSRVKGNWKPTADILDGETGQIVASLKLTTAEEEAVLAATEWITHLEATALAFSPSEDLLAVGTSIGQVKLYHARTGELVRSLDDAPAKLADQKAPENWRSLRRAIGSVASLAFSPDGSLLAVCGGSFDDYPGVLDGVRRFTRKTTAPGRVKVFDVKSGTLLHDLVGHSYANTVAYSPDGNLLASAGSWLGPGGDDDGTGVIIWSPGTAERIRTITSDANAGTQSVVFSPDSKMIVFGADQYDRQNATTVTVVGMTYVLSGISGWVQLVPGGGIPQGFSPDGKSVFVLCQQSVRFLNAETGAVEREVTSADLSAAGRWDDIAIAPQAGRLVIGSVDEEEGNVALWDLAAPAAAPVLESLPEPATDAP